MSFLVKRLSSVRRHTRGYLSLYVIVFALFSLYQSLLYLAGELPEVAPQLGRGLKEYDRFPRGITALQGVSNQTDPIKEKQFDPPKPDLVENDIHEKQTLDDIYLSQDFTLGGVTFSIPSEQDEQKVISSNLYSGVANQQHDKGDMSEDRRSHIEDLFRDVFQFQLSFHDDSSVGESEPQGQQQQEQPFPFHIQPPIPPEEPENPPRMTVEQHNPEQEAHFDTVEDNASQSELIKSPQQGQGSFGQSQNLVNGNQEYKALDLQDLSPLNLGDTQADRPEMPYGNLNLESMLQTEAVQPDMLNVAANQQSLNREESVLDGLGKPMSGIPYNIHQDGSDNNVRKQRAIHVPGMGQPLVVAPISAAERIQKQLSPSFQSQNARHPILAPDAPAPIQWDVPQTQAYQPHVPPKEFMPLKQGHSYIYSQGIVPIVPKQAAQQYIPAHVVPEQSAQMRPVDQLVINNIRVPNTVAMQQAPTPVPVQPSQGLPLLSQPLFGGPVIQPAAEFEMNPGTLDNSNSDYAYYMEDGADGDYADPDAGYPLEIHNLNDDFDTPTQLVENSSVIEESNKISLPPLSGTHKHQVVSDEEEDDIYLESTPHSGARVKPLPVVPRRLVYNRVGKCGSTTVKSIIKGLSLRNGFSFVSSREYRVRRIPTTQEQVRIDIRIASVNIYLKLLWFYSQINTICVQISLQRVGVKTHFGRN